MNILIVVDGRHLSRMTSPLECAFGDQCYVRFLNMDHGIGLIESRNWDVIIFTHEAMAGIELDKKTETWLSSANAHCFKVIVKDAQL